MTSSPRSHPGFSMTEILVGLAIFGIIFAVALPMIAAKREDVIKRVVFRETITLLTGILQRGLDLQELSTDNWGSYFLDHLNAVETCRTNAEAEGCWQTSLQGSVCAYHQQPGAILTNGVSITGFEDTSSALCGADNCANGFIIDYNGLKPPNRVGQDQLYMVAAYGESWSFPVARYGTLGAVPSIDPACPAPTAPATATDITDNVPLYNWIYQ